MLKCYFVSFFLNEEAEIPVTDFKQPAPKDIVTPESNSFILQGCIEVNPDRGLSICLFILDSFHSQITDLIKLNRNERWQTGRRLCNCFPKEAGACPGGAFFSDALGAENTCLPQIIKSGRWTEGGSKIWSNFRWLPLFFISSILKFCCTEPSKKTEWPSAAVTSSFGIDFMLKRFIQKGEDWDRELFAGTWVCLWDQAQSHSCDGTVMHGVDFFSRVMLCCCTLQILAVSLKKKVTYLFYLQQLFYKITEMTPGMVVLFFIFFFFLGMVYSHGLEK